MKLVILQIVGNTYVQKCRNKIIFITFNPGLISRLKVLKMFFILPLNESTIYKEASRGALK